MHFVPPSIESALSAAAIADERPGIARIFLVFAYVGATSFGGGVAAYLHEHLVEHQHWLEDDEFLAALEIGQTVPGLIATNVSVIIGSHLRGVRGAIAAAVGMIIPGAIAICGLGVAYMHLRHNPRVLSALGSVSAAAVGLILSVTLQIARRELKGLSDLLILLGTFLLVAIGHLSLVPVLALLVPIAIWINRPSNAVLTDYHSKRAAYHAQMAAHHQERADVLQGEPR